jgi:hypothetical protein
MFCSNMLVLGSCVARKEIVRYSGKPSPLKWLPAGKRGGCVYQHELNIVPVD